jgi:hypothetical protein
MNRSRRYAEDHYGSRSKRGTEVAALFYSLIESSKLCRVEPKAYLLQAVRAALASPELPRSPRRCAANGAPARSRHRGRTAFRVAGQFATIHVESAAIWRLPPCSLEGVKTGMATIQSRPPLQPGQPAPDFTLPTVPDEGFVSLADYRGRSPLLLVLLRTVGR